MTRRGPPWDGTLLLVLFCLTVRRLVRPRAASAIKVALAAAMLACLAPVAAYAAHDPHGAAEVDAQRAALCSRPHWAPIGADDPALALYRGNGESEADVEVWIAIERANSCDEPPAGMTRSEIIYAIQTGGQFLCDDHPDLFPDRCGVKLERRR